MPSASRPKHNEFVASAQRGGSTMRQRIARDSVWGYVDAQRRLYRLQGPDDYRVEQADTLTIYSRNATTAGTDQTTGYRGSVGGSVYTTQHYYFGRGLTGRIYPSPKNTCAKPTRPPARPSWRPWPSARWPRVVCLRPKGPGVLLGWAVSGHGGK